MERLQGEGACAARAGGSGGEEIDLDRVGRLVAVGLVVMVGLAGLVAVVGRAATVDVEGVAPAGPHLAAELTEVIGVAGAGTVAIGSVGCQGSMLGSGVLIDGWVVTARHLVDAADHLDVAGVGRLQGISHAGEIDLAAAPLGVDGGAAVSLASADAVVGESLVLAGRPAGELRWLQAEVHAVVPGDAYGSNGRLLLLDATTALGFSGGPVLDRHGQLVGILSAVDTETGLTLAVPVSELRAWLESSEDRQADSRCDTPASDLD